MGNGDPQNSYRNANELSPSYVFINNIDSGNNASDTDNDGRTLITGHRVKIVVGNEAQGDHLAFSASVRVAGVKPEATTWLANSAGGIIGGTVIGEADGVYLNPREIVMNDQVGNTDTFTADVVSGSPTLSNVSIGSLKVGNRISGTGIPTGAYVTAVSGSTATMSANATATTNGLTITRIKAVRVAAVGDVINMHRNRASDAGGLGEPWHAYRAQSTGTLPVDTIISATGKFFSGIDLSMPALSFVDKAAIALKASDRIYFNASAAQLNDATTFIRANHRATTGLAAGGSDTSIFYDPSVNRLVLRVNGVNTLQVSNGRITVTAMTANDDIAIADTKGIFVNGQRILGNRVTGWVPLNGPSDKSTLWDTGTITLPQLAQRLKAIESALFTSAGNHGLIGA